MAKAKKTKIGKAVIEIVPELDEAAMARVERRIREANELDLADRKVALDLAASFVEGTTNTYPLEAQTMPGPNALMGRYEVGRAQQHLDMSIQLADWLLGR